MKLSDQVAVITGGANGIGAETAMRFLREGARVVIGDLNEANAARTAVAAAQAGLSERLRFVKADVTEEAQVEALFDTALAEFGAVDCVFNNAGVGARPRSGVRTRVHEVPRSASHCRRAFPRRWKE